MSTLARFAVCGFRLYCPPQLTSTSWRKPPKESSFTLQTEIDSGGHSDSITHVESRHLKNASSRASVCLLEINL